MMLLTRTFRRLLLTIALAGTMLLGELSVRAEETSAPTQPLAQRSFAEMHLGLFVHYTYVGRAYRWGSTQWADGAAVRSLDELADNLDVEDLADRAAEMRAQYVMLTTWHANMNALYPSKVLQRRLPGHCSRRDVIADLIHALRARNIRLILYIHPSDGFDFSREDQDRAGWTDSPPYTRWNDFINEVVAELVDRYGKDVAGYFIDGGLPAQVDRPRLRKTILARQPGAWLIQNGGLKQDCVDYGSKEAVHAPFPATTWQASCIVTGWWAQGRRVSVSPESAYRYTILQAAVCGRQGGGAAWSFGPYPGGRWEPGVRDFATQLGQLVDRAGPSFFGTRPSTAYVTKAGCALESVPYVATESPDGKKTYLHVFSAPKGHVLQLPTPADGRRFSTAQFLTGIGKVTVSQTNTGVALRLDDTARWDDVDTIILLGGGSNWNAQAAEEDRTGDSLSRKEEEAAIAFESACTSWYDKIKQQHLEPLDPAAQARRALEGFMTLGPQRLPGPEGYYRAVFASRLLPKPARGHARWDCGDCTARAILAWHSLREMTGDAATGREVEAGQRAYLLSLLHPQTGLVYTPDLSDKEKGTYRYIVWDQSRTLRALVLWYENTPEDRVCIKPLIDRMLRGLDEFSQVRGTDKIWGPYCGWSCDEFSNHDPIAFGAICAAPVGICIEPVVRYAELTGDPRALDLALRFTSFELGGHLREGGVPLGHLPKNLDRICGFNPDGSFWGHLHSKSGTLLGIVKLSRHLAKLGRMEEAKRYLNEVRKSYEWMFAPDNPTRSSRIGWILERPENQRVNETCCCADMIELAEAMAQCADLTPEFHNWADFHDDAESMTVNTIARVQIRFTPEFAELLRTIYGNSAKTQMQTARRFDGAWPFSYPPNAMAGKGPGMFLGGCCQYAGVRGLYTGWRDAMHFTDGNLYINYFLNRRSLQARMTTDVPGKGEARIVMKQTVPLFVRVPGYLKPKQMTLSVDGRSITSKNKFDQTRHYIALGECKKGTEIRISFPLTERVTKERIADQDFTIHWRGNYVVKMEPRDKVLPVFP